MNNEQNVLMKIFAQKLRDRAEQLGISNAEAARRIGLEERRYAHYAAGRREPDFKTLKSIAEKLGTTPSWLLGFIENPSDDSKKDELISRFYNAATLMTSDELELSVIQAEAIVAKSLNKTHSN